MRISSQMTFHNMRCRLTCFSRTHILTSDSNSSGLEAMFSAAILARAVPHDPEPTIATLCFPEARGDVGRGDARGDGGRVAAANQWVILASIRQNKISSKLFLASPLASHSLRSCIWATFIRIAFSRRLPRLSKQQGPD